MEPLDIFDKRLLFIYDFNIFMHETTECYTLENAVSDSVETFVGVKPLDNCNETLEYFPAVLLAANVAAFHNSVEIFATKPSSIFLRRWQLCLWWPKQLNMIFS